MLGRLSGYICKNLWMIKIDNSMISAQIAHPKQDVSALQDVKKGVQMWKDT